MPLYQFTAVDPSGEEKSGVMRGANAEEVTSRLEWNGLRVRRIELDGGTDRPASEPLPPERKPEPEPKVTRPRSQRAEAEEDRRPARRRSGGGGGGIGTAMHWTMTSLAVLVAVFALVIALVRDPLGGGSYDFSTPEASMRSRLKIDVNGDVRAMIDVQKRTGGRKAKEQLDSLQVSREADFKGKKILFYSYRKDGKTRYATEGFEKDSESGYWVYAYLSSYDVEKENKTLAEEMRKWEAQGEPEFKW